ncbi:MAG: hypothetical protein JSW35_09630 [Deltaproteobacteria bacterium]|nr:MAG: hypothetical protein JSW35_09630 [Deltaproteobacteria bacterium]
MDLKSSGEKEARRSSREKGPLTIMIFTDVGKVRRFMISPRLILFASLFLLFYIVATIYVTNKYFDARRIHNVQADQITKLSRRLMKTTESLQRSKHHIALLEDYMSDAEAQDQEPESAGSYTELPLPTIVDIEDVNIRRDGATLYVTFRIVNRQENEEPLVGYIFVLASPKDSDPSEVWVYPRSSLKDGLPVNYTRGHRFFIERFMSIESKLRIGGSVDMPLILQILVYNRDGTLILEKLVEV